MARSDSSIRRFCLKLVLVPLDDDAEKGSQMGEQYDVVIIGGGIAGSGLATMLARGGKEVLLLEQTNAYSDIVRGEIMSQWGVKEADAMGLLDALLGAGAHFVNMHLGGE